MRQPHRTEKMKTKKNKNQGDRRLNPSSAVNVKSGAPSGVRAAISQPAVRNDRNSRRRWNILNIPPCSASQTVLRRLSPSAHVKPGIKTSSAANRRRASLISFVSSAIPQQAVVHLSGNIWRRAWERRWMQPSLSRLEVPVRGGGRGRVTGLVSAGREWARPASALVYFGSSTAASLPSASSPLSLTPPTL